MDEPTTRRMDNSAPKLTSKKRKVLIERRRGSPTRRRTDDVLRHTKDIMNSMEQGVLVWSADGCCEMFNARVFDVLELPADGLHVGMQRQDFLGAAIARKEFSTATADTIHKKFSTATPFNFDRKIPSGRIIETMARPRDAGGFVVTFTDVTEARRAVAQIGSAKERAEAAERSLQDELHAIQIEKEAIEKDKEILKRTSLVAEHAKDVITITDRTGTIEWVNRSFVELTGFTLEEAAGHSPDELLFGTETDPKTAMAINAAFQDRQSTKAEVLNYSKTGQAYWVEMEIVPVFNDRGEHTNFIAVERDITDRKLSELRAADALEIERNRQRASELLSHLNEWLQSCKSLDELFDVVSAFLSRVLPGSSGALYTYSNSRDVLDGACAWHEGVLLDHIRPDDCWGLRRGRPYLFGTTDVEFVCQHVEEHTGAEPVGRYFCIPIVAHGETVGLLHIAFSMDECDHNSERAIRERKLAKQCAEQISLAIANVRLRDQLRDQSIRDPLTNLYNRRYFLENCRREIRRAQSRERPLSIISVDVDHFKRFNDNHGHDAGDTVLRSLGETMTKVFCGEDMACRLGGEEFVALLPNRSQQDAVKLAEALRTTVEDLVVRYGDKNLPRISISAGVATFPEDGETPQVLLKAADKALYQAKDLGRNCIAIPASEPGAQTTSPALAAE